MAQVKRPIPKRKPTAGAPAPAPTSPAVDKPQRTAEDMAYDMVKGLCDAILAEEPQQVGTTTQAVAQEIEETPLIQASRFKMNDRVDGLMVSGIFIPGEYNVRTDVDPIAERYLEELYDGQEIDADIIGIYQEPHELHTTEGSILVAARGVYLVYVSHPESDSYIVDFARIGGMGYVYEGKWPTPNVRKENYITLSQDPRTRADELDIIKSTFEWGR